MLTAASRCVLPGNRRCWPVDVSSFAGFPAVNGDAAARPRDGRRLVALPLRRPMVMGCDARDQRWRQTLLACGIVSSLLYAVMIWEIRYDGYSPLSQVPSELTAIGAPTRAL